ncbi:MAG: metal-dependent hydrolase [Deltaproteobacteria bacterium]|nr:metal-dependent hydrolase [Deltaproteobacteria bacterium]
MSPVTHFLLSWSTASAFALCKRDRVLVTLAGTIPDIDGIGLLWDLPLSHASGGELVYWSRFHHVLGHNIVFCLALVFCAYFLVSRRIMACSAVFLVFHLHLLCDLAGSRGPDQYWSIPYLMPLSPAWDFVWAGQWPLNSWQNFVITAGAVIYCGYMSWKKGISPVEVFSHRANQAFVDTLRKRFGASLEQLEK